MWYAVETVFIDGKLFGSQCLFDEDDAVKGCCYCSHNEEPMNSSHTEFGGRIEIHCDWFETKELAMRFQDGEITYKHIYEAYYKPSIKSTLTQFVKREIVELCGNNGALAHRGIYEKVLLDYMPYWAE